MLLQFAGVKEAAAEDGGRAAALVAGAEDNDNQIEKNMYLIRPSGC